jgi:hypothetical protein
MTGYAYGSSVSANVRTPSTQIVYLDPLQVQYEELQNLRRRVRKVEAAAAAQRVIHRSRGDMAIYCLPRGQVFGD